MRRQSLRLALTLLAFVIGFAALFYPIFITQAVAPADYKEPAQIIQQEGEFIFTDGSSFYLLKRDGTFRSGPLGLSGREIEGTWKQKDNLFVIEGRWGWMNGLSAENDLRRMVLYIGAPTSIETVKRPSLVDGRMDVKIYKCYFEVEELQKITKP